MDLRKKILLNSADVKNKKDDDYFIDLEITRTYNSFKENEYDNTFDLQERFNTERNNSRDFTIYGVIDSRFFDCDNILIELYAGGDMLIGHLNTVPLFKNFQSNGVNIFNKKKGRYIIHLNNYKTDEIKMVIYNSNTKVLSTGSYEKRKTLLYYSIDPLTGISTVIPFGTKTTNVNISTSTNVNGDSFINIVDGNLIVSEDIVDNDWPFLQNRHWIKNNLFI